MSAYSVIGKKDNDEVMLGGGADIEVEMVEPRGEKVGSSLSRRMSEAYSPLANTKAPVVLTWKDLTVSVTKRNKTKVLLNNISGHINGGFWAIIGSSGGGKTTLLNALSQRLDSYISMSGDLALNGRSYTRSDLKNMSAYVMQDDVLMAELTVEETMAFTAKMRMDKNCTDKERKDRSDDLLELLGIDHVKDVKVGNTVTKGISGGERKRLCIAMELLNKPSLLFLDEPTSGLDSFTSLVVCRALQQLASRGECTVICTIHQPQQQIFDLFDNLILMKKGQIMYQGVANKTLDFLHDCIGLQIPAKVNTADFLLDVLANEENLGKFSSDRLSLMREDFNCLEVDLSAGCERPVFKQREEHSWIVQFMVLMSRNFTQINRRWDLTLMTIVMSAIMALFVGGGDWLNLKDKVGQQFVGKWPSSIFFCFLTEGIAASFQAIHQFPLERALSIRERSAGTYNVSAYFLAKSLSDLSVQMLGPIVYCIIVYPMIGYQARADKFITFLFCLMMDSACATGLATMISCWCVNLNLTTVVLSVGMEICRVYGGFFIPPALMAEHAAWRWADSVSYLKYCFLAGVITQLEDLEFECTAAELASNTCTVTRGEQVMASRGYDEYTVGQCLGAATGFVIGYRLIGYIGLKYLKN